MLHRPAHIRNLDINDVDDVIQLYEQLGYSISSKHMKTRLQILIDDRATQLYVACTPERKVIGFVYINQRQTVESGAIAQLMGLVVDEAHQGLGIGRQLLLVAEVWARSRDVKTIILNSRINRPSAHAFYQKVGFDIQKQQLRLIKKIN